MGRGVDRYYLELFDGRRFDVHHRACVGDEWIEVRAPQAECRVFIERGGAGFYRYDLATDADRRRDTGTLIRQLRAAMIGARRRESASLVWPPI
jgi:hypothetical protein